MGLVFLFACLICLSLHSTFSRLAPLLDLIELFGRSEIQPFNVCVIEFSLTDALVPTSPNPARRESTEEWNLRTNLVTLLIVFVAMWIHGTQGETSIRG
jgi:hypothetical protein